jgi:hypothetical protein
MTVNFEAILQEAHEEAALAVEGKVDNPRAFDCGFAWVTLGGNEPLVRYCRKVLKGGNGNSQKHGSKGWPNGWQWWNPGGYMGQSIGVKEKGAQAFRDALARHGISATVGSRLD